MQKNKVLISKRKYTLPQFKYIMINILTEKENAFLSALYGNVILAEREGNFPAALLPQASHL